MNYYMVIFKGRKLGALGRYYEITTDVWADSRDSAVGSLYKKYDLLMRPWDQDVIVIKSSK